MKKPFEKDTLLALSAVSQYSVSSDGQKQKILDKINLELKKGEIIAIVGKSGSGKSTLLKIMAGVLVQNKGKCTIYGDYTTDNIGMIFQTFALFPWFNVLENVKLGLQTLDIPEEERTKRALDTISLIGLNGFEEAYPRELSAGMKQRVAFARALVLGSVILLMDEPFSTLDVLTSNTLKSDFLTLWNGKKTPMQSVVIVTHSIEEAVSMADRVFILGSNPGHIVAEIEVLLPRPRNNNLPEFHSLVENIYVQMAHTSELMYSGAKNKGVDDKIGQKLPVVSANQLAAMADTLAGHPYKGSANLADLSREMQLSTADILPIIEGLIMLKFANLSSGNIKLLPAGKTYAKSGIEQRKAIFSEHLLEYVPLISYIHKTLNARPDRQAPKLRFLSHLEDFLPVQDAKKSLNTAIIWGRYAGLFSYDDNREVFLAPESNVS